MWQRDCSVAVSIWLWWGQTESSSKGNSRMSGRLWTPFMLACLPPSHQLCVYCSVCRGQSKQTLPRVPTSLKEIHRPKPWLTLALIQFTCLIVLKTKAHRSGEILILHGLGLMCTSISGILMRAIMAHVSWAEYTPRVPSPKQLLRGIVYTFTYII